MTDMVGMANTLLRGPHVGVPEVLPRVVSLESRITKAWDDLAEIARDARHSYDSEGLTLAATCMANAARELFTIAELIGQAERNAEPREQ